MSQVTESLAARLAVVELSPFTAAEVKPLGEPDRHWLWSGGVLAAEAYPDGHSNYLEDSCR
jgi:hypothetical protein